MDFYVCNKHMNLNLNSIISNACYVLLIMSTHNQIDI